MAPLNILQDNMLLEAFQFPLGHPQGVRAPSEALLHRLLDRLCQVVLSVSYGTLFPSNFLSLFIPRYKQPSLTAKKSQVLHKDPETCSPEPGSLLILRRSHLFFPSYGNISICELSIVFILRRKRSL